VCFPFPQRSNYQFFYFSGYLRRYAPIFNRSFYSPLILPPRSFPQLFDFQKVDMVACIGLFVRIPHTGSLNWLFPQRPLFIIPPLFPLGPEQPHSIDEINVETVSKTLRSVPQFEVRPFALPFLFVIFFEIFFAFSFLCR